MPYLRIVQPADPHTVLAVFSLYTHKCCKIHKVLFYPVFHKHGGWFAHVQICHRHRHSAAVCVVSRLLFCVPLIWTAWRRSVQYLLVDTEHLWSTQASRKQQQGHRTINKRTMKRVSCKSKAVIDKEHVCVGVFKVLWFPLGTYGNGVLLGPVFYVKTDDGWRTAGGREGGREASVNMLFNWHGRWWICTNSGFR